MDDEKIIELFFSRSENAIKELAAKYEKVCMTLSMNILGSREDAEECLNDTYLGVWNAIPPQKPDNLTAFVCKIARNLSLKKNTYNSAEKRQSNYGVCIDELSECIPSNHTVESEMPLLIKPINFYLSDDTFFPTPMKAFLSIQVLKNRLSVHAFHDYVPILKNFLHSRGNFYETAGYIQCRRQY